MALPFLAGAEGAYPIIVKLATGDNVVDLGALKYDATTNPRGINSADDYVVYFEPLATGASLCALGIKVTGGAVVKSGTSFTLLADAALNTVSVIVWVIPHGGVMRTVI